MRSHDAPNKRSTQQPACLCVERDMCSMYAEKACVGLKQQEEGRGGHDLIGLP